MLGLTLDELGSGRDVSGEPKVTAARSGKTYFGPIYFRNESEPYMTIAVGGGPAAIAVGDGVVWVVDTVAGALIPIDARTNELGTPIELAPGISSVRRSATR